MHTEIITPLTYNKIQRWYASAINDKYISRWLSLSTDWAVPEDSKSNWGGTFIVDSNGKPDYINIGLAALYPNRTSGNYRATVSVYVLPFGSILRRQLIAGRLMKAIEKQALAQNITWLEWYVHETNLKSLSISKRVTSQFSVQREGAWDSFQSKWVTLHGFQKRLHRKREQQ